jgi:glutamine cyclotransferase
MAGMNGESSVREVDLETGVVRRKKMLQHADFAEGVTRFGDKCAWAPPKRLHRCCAPCLLESSW